MNSSITLVLTARPHAADLLAAMVAEEWRGDWILRVVLIAPLVSALQAFPPRKNNWLVWKPIGMGQGLNDVAVRYDSPRRALRALWFCCHDGVRGVFVAHDQLLSSTQHVRTPRTFPTWTWRPASSSAVFSPCAVASASQRAHSKRSSGGTATNSPRPMLPHQYVQVWWLGTPCLWCVPAQRTRCVRTALGLTMNGRHDVHGT